MCGFAFAIGGAALYLASTLNGSVAPPVASPLAPSEDLVAETNAPSRLVRAAAADIDTADSAAETDATDGPGAPSPRTKGPTPTRTPAPVVRAAPSEALPTERMRALSIPGSPPVSRPAVVSAAVESNAPLSIALVPANDAASSLTNALVDRLDSAGWETTASSLSDAPGADLLLVLDARAFGAWYCDQGASTSAALARQLEASLAATSSVETEPVVDCDALLDGRARTTLVFLGAPGSPEETAEALSTTLNRYLTSNSAALKRQRLTTRLVWPASGPITNYYGPQHPLGIDVGQFTGPVVAATEGVVSFAGGDPCCSYGYHVVVDSGGGVRTLYAHFSSLKVKAGDKVRQGQQLGLIGCTGHCDGPHLHFEVLIDGRRVDPMRYLP